MMSTITYYLTKDDAQIPQGPANYTQVSGLYSGQQIRPQFLSATDNVQQSPDEWQKATQSFNLQNDLFFFRMR